MVSLLILAEIATFTIPKIITGQQNGRNNSIVKETVAAVSAAYQQYQLSNTSVSGSAGVSDFTSYLNYLSVDSSTVIDDKQTLGSYTCGSGSYANCLKLHNGAMLRYGSSGVYNFGGTSTTNATWFDIDPDGAYSGTTNGSGKAVEFWLYYNGRLSSYGALTPNTCHNGGCINPTPAYDPPWFSW